MGNEGKLGGVRIGWMGDKGTLFASWFTSFYVHKSTLPQE